MKSNLHVIGVLLLSTYSLLTLAGCGKVNAQADAQTAGAPPAPNVVPFADAALFSVDHPEQFPLAAATQHPTTSELVVTGTVTPDVSRNIPVVSLASGRVIAIHTRLGDTVQKGQLLMTIRSDDVSGGYSNYRMAVADEILARTQYERSKDLYEHGAIALNDLQVAQDTEDKAKIAVETMAEHLRLLGNDPDKPAFMVDIFAPVSGIITDQQVTNAAAVQAFSTPSPFTISDLSSVWVVCDVYENDLASVRLGDTAEITPECLSRSHVQGKGEQHRLDSRSQHPHRQGSDRSSESGNHAAGHVREGHLPRSNHGDAHHCPGIRRPAHARSRFCLRSRARQEVSPRGSRRWRPLVRQRELAGDQVGAGTRPTSGHERAGLGPRARSVTVGRMFGIRSDS